jgi:probable F420-dependent oxidoreductase
MRVGASIRAKAVTMSEKVRIGVGLGRGALTPEGLGEVADGLVDAGLDSIWLSEVLTAQGFDPLVALAFLAARQPRLKLGTTMLLPGRNLVRLAKSLGSLDCLSSGRLLVTFVPGLAVSPEREAIGFEFRRRGEAIDEALPVLRRLLAGEKVSHSGITGSFEDVTLAPIAVQQPIEFWLGGMAPASLERCGRLADGWLPSLCTPDEAAQGRKVIEEAADKAGREIDPGHFGVSVGYARAPLDDAAVRSLAPRGRRSRPELIPVGRDGLRACIESFVGVGFTKFVARPVQAPSSWSDELGWLAANAGDLQT